MRKIERKIPSLGEHCQRNQSLFISGAGKPNLCPCQLMEKEKADKANKKAQSAERKAAEERKKRLAAEGRVDKNIN